MPEHSSPSDENGASGHSALFGVLQVLTNRPLETVGHKRPLPSQPDFVELTEEVSVKFEL